MAPGLRLTARLLQHPGADRHDQAAVFRHRNEARGRYVAQIGIAPAQQRLGADRPPADDVELGLVMQMQFGAEERLMQTVLQQQVFLCLEVHPFVEEAIGVAPRILGVVHGRVGLLQQAIEIAAVFGV